MKLKCGQFTFEINYNEQWKVPQNAIEFIGKNKKIDVKYKIDFVDKIEHNNEQIIHERNNIVVTKNNKNLESRYLIITGDHYPYAFYKEINKENINIQVLNKFKDKFSLDTFFWSLFALEKHMIQNNSVILHCNYIIYKNHAILFSGPSEIGKSTQGDLWKKYRDTPIINGDRGLILKEDNKWYADGWPVCGSSEICCNKKTPLGAIVFLKQGKDNKVSILDKKSAIKQLIGQITINYWNKDFVNKAISIAENICDEVNIYELTCTPDIRAIETLEDMLKENEIWMD